MQLTYFIFWQENVSYFKSLFNSTRDLRDVRSLYDTQLFKRLAMDSEKIHFNTSYNAFIHILKEHGFQWPSIISGIKDYSTKIYSSFTEEKLVNKEEFVIIEKNNYIKEEYEYISRAYPNMKFFQGKFDNLLNQNTAWSFKNAKNSMYPKYFNWFYESGCYNYRYKLNRNKDNTNRKYFTDIIRNITNINNKTNEAVPLGLSKTFKTFFYLWSVFLAIAIFTVTFEIIKENWYITLNGVKKLVIIILNKTYLLFKYIINLKKFKRNYKCKI